MAPDHTYTVLPRPLPAETNLSAYVCVSAHLNQEREKRVVFLTARVHPGESPASFICQGKTLSRLDTHIHSPMMS